MSKRWLVPAVPFAVSLCLSISTVGAHPFWQDSGLYLTAIKELGVLYPPGFVLYEVLCFLWTRVLFFVDFTLAVHLFSSLCAALAAGTTAVATRDLLKSRGKVFWISQLDPGPLADYCGMLTGVLLAGGFTFWSTAIIAKGYTFYYLILSLLLWRMIRADESGRPRDFTIVAALIGLAWQAHPSAALIGVALVLFVAVHRQTLGWKGIAGRTAVAAACALGPSILLHPILASRDPWLMFDRPESPGAFVRYILGLRFVGSHGAFGFDARRALSFLRFLWEDALGVGLLLMTVGLIRTNKENRRLMIGLLAWVLPYALITILFKTEGQHDCWFVAARMPLVLACGVGAWHIAVNAGPQAKVVLTIAGVVATGWAAAVNYSDLNQRNYRLAEQYGSVLLDSVDYNSIVLLRGDDSNGLASYLHRVRGERPDLILVTSSFLMSGWYEGELIRRDPVLFRPDYEGLQARFPSLDRRLLAAAAFINANAGQRPIFCEFPVPPDALDVTLMMAPAGVHWKVVPRGTRALPDEKYWRFPIEPEAVRPLYRRARGQQLTPTPDGEKVKPQRYERRYAAMILTARFQLALALNEHRQFAQAAKLCQSIIDFDDEDFESNPEIIHLLGTASFASGDFDRAAKALRVSAAVSVRKENKATALYYLSQIARRKGDLEGAKFLYEQAVSVPGLDPAFLKQMEGESRK